MVTVISSLCIRSTSPKLSADHRFLSSLCRMFRLFANENEYLTSMYSCKGCHPLGLECECECAVCESAGLRVCESAGLRVPEDASIGPRSMSINFNFKFIKDFDRRSAY